MRLIPSILTGAWLLSLLGGCPDASPPVDEPACVAGAVANCVCGSVIGQKACKSDGSAWGECRCTSNPDAAAGDALQGDVTAGDSTPIESGQADGQAVDGGLVADSSSQDGALLADAGTGDGGGGGLDADCLEGYFGANCEPCTCVNGECSDGRGGDGTCLSCDSLYFGTNCENLCYCDHGTCDDGPDGLGHCLDCYTGEFGQDCEEICTCHPIGGICNDGITGDGLCISCTNRYFGQNCDGICTCDNGTCNQGLTGDGHCSSCDPGYFGEDCVTACTCVNGTCNEGISGDGHCSACENGFFGLNCENACECVHGSCAEGPSGDGACTCETGWEGATCAVKKFTIAVRSAAGDNGYAERCVRNPDATLSCTNISELPVSSVAQLGKSGICVIKNDGAAVCSSNSVVPEPNSGWMQVASGGWAYNCGLKQNGSVTCWGSGTLCTQYTNHPSPNSGFVSIAVNSCIACGVREDASVSCWGAGPNDGALNYNLPSQNSGITEIVPASQPTCVLKSGNVECNGFSGSPAKPAPNTNGDFVEIASAGWNRVCGLHSNGVAECWGASSGVPATNERFYDIDMGMYSFTMRACAVRTDGTHECWVP